MIDLTRLRIPTFLIALFVAPHMLVVALGPGLHAGFLCPHREIAGSHHAKTDGTASFYSLVSDPSEADECLICHFFAQAQVPGCIPSTPRRETVAFRVEATHWDSFQSRDTRPPSLRAPPISHMA